MANFKYALSILQPLAATISRAPCVARNASYVCTRIILPNKHHILSIQISALLCPGP